MEKALFTFLLLPSLLLFLSVPSPCISSRECNPEDRKVLLKLNKALIKQGFLGWETEVGCCDWGGVRCAVETDRVIGLDIRFTLVSGQIPAVVSELPHLQLLVFHKMPSLTGPIPPSIAKLTNLKSLWLRWTNLSGPVPSFLGQLKNLTDLDLSYNNFSGSIPPALAELPNLEYLRLDRNKLTGNIPESFEKFAGRAIDLRLSHNQLTGQIPRSFGKTNFARLDLARNKLQGDISFLFGTSKSNLGYVDFLRNMLEFDLSKVEFPASLNWLDLNHNRIFGSLPVGLTGLDLVIFNVSYNRLCGQIPSGGALQGLEYTSYFHNRCLCGAPLPACK